MTWNYRVVRRQVGDEVEFVLVDAYYDEDDKVTAWAANPQAPMGATIEELRSDLEYMIRALEQPLLDVSADPLEGTNACP